MMLLRIPSISYFNVIAYYLLKGYQNGNHIEPSEQRLQEISIAKKEILREVNFSQCLFLAAIILSALVYMVVVLVALKPDSTL